MRCVRWYDLNASLPSDGTEAAAGSTKNEYVSRWKPFETCHHVSKRISTHEKSTRKQISEYAVISQLIETS